MRRFTLVPSSRDVRTRYREARLDAPADDQNALDRQRVVAAHPRSAVQGYISSKIRAMPTAILPPTQLVGFAEFLRGFLAPAQLVL
jgi:hypothetical protein